MLRCLVIDDEPLALDLMGSFVKKTPFLQLVAQCESAVAAIELIRNESIDLIFLDIEMPDINGIQFLKSLQQQPMVIFTTAYEQYAIEGFDLNVMDYLLKPIPYERFVKAANKALELHQLKTQPAAPPSKTFIAVKSDYQIVRIKIDDILYIEGLKDYIKIITAEKNTLTLQSLKAIEEELTNHGFIRIHRSYVVPMDKIDAIRKNSIKIGKEELPVGESYKEHFMQKMGL